MDPVITASRVIILIPIYRDWTSASTLCRLLDDLLMRLPQAEVQAILVDDGSPDGLAGWIPMEECRSLTRVSVVRLRVNLGHQRAICTGLCYISENIPCEWVLVMDADGEDRPEDAVRLVEMALSQSAPVLFAQRRKRLERPLFRAGYAAFRVLHRILTGVPVRVGNFSIISQSILSRLVAMPELWNHYAGAIFKSKVQFECVPMDRGKRFHGESKMNLVSLMTHGLAGIATFYETVATRILIFNALALILLVMIFAVVVAVRLLTGVAVPGWAAYTAGLIIIVFTQLVALSFNLVFSLVSSRTRATFLPLRDYAMYLVNQETLSTPNVRGQGAE